MRENGWARAVRRLEAVAGLAMIGAVGLIAMQIAADQVVNFPPPPPTPSQRAAALPAAKAGWRVVYPQLLARLPPYDGNPLELGKVWMTRTGRFCGLVNDREAGVDRMAPFYTIGASLRLRDDDLLGYFHVWRSCAQDEWVVLHQGTTYTGFCASARGRVSRFGKEKCVSWMARSLALAP